MVMLLWCMCSEAVRVDRLDHRPKCLIWLVFCSLTFPQQVKKPNWLRGTFACQWLARDRRTLIYQFWNYSRMWRLVFGTQHGWREPVFLIGLLARHLRRRMPMSQLQGKHIPLCNWESELCWKGWNAGADLLQRCGPHRSIECGRAWSRNQTWYWKWRWCLQVLQSPCSLESFSLLSSWSHYITHSHAYLLLLDRFQMWSCLRHLWRRRAMEPTEWLQLCKRRLRPRLFRT